MKKLLFFPSDPIQAYLEKGRDYEFLDNYYNPGSYFDEVICVSPWGEREDETISRIRYIKSSPDKFRSIIKRMKPDVVRGYGGYCCADWAVASKVRGIPTIVSVHDTNPQLIHSSLKNVDGIICMSEAVKKAVLEQVPDISGKIWVMPNRIDTEVYQKKTNNELTHSLNERFPGQYHVLHVGRKTEQKNLDTVIKALTYLPKGVVVIFVGQGDTTEFEKMAESFGVAERCFFVDRVESQELPYWYSWCDCMCTPSRWEGFGYVFIEAAACEAGIVTSNIGPMNEYLTHEENAILINDYENPKEVANGVRRIIDNSEDIQTMKKNARGVGLRFSKEIVDQQEMAIYEEMMFRSKNIKPSLLKRIKNRFI